MGNPARFSSVTTIAFDVEHVDELSPTEDELTIALLNRVADLLKNRLVLDATGGELVDTQPID